MNRIHNLVDDELDCVLGHTASVTALDREPQGELDQTHCIFTPLHYERNYAYPLIVWLHGPDDDEHQVTRIIPLVSMRNYVAVGPRGTLGSARAPEAYCWSQEPRHIALADERVLSAVSAARRWLNIAPSRIYLAGYASGGTMALRLALNQPRVFAGVLSIGGAFPATLRPLGQLQAARCLKIFLATGRDSRQYPETQVCNHLRLFHAAGMSVDLRQYPCGDELTTHMLADMNRWIMAPLTERRPAAADEPSHRFRGQ
jgi:phospholipase/carboxylesterase